MDVPIRFDFLGTKVVPTRVKATKAGEWSIVAPEYTDDTELRLSQVEGYVEGFTAAKKKYELLRSQIIEECRNEVAHENKIKLEAIIHNFKFRVSEVQDYLVKLAEEMTDSLGYIYSSILLKVESENFYSAKICVDKLIYDNLDVRYNIYSFLVEKLHESEFKEKLIVGLYRIDSDDSSKTQSIHFDYNGRYDRPSETVQTQ